MDSVEHSPTTEVTEKKTSERFSDSSIADVTFVSKDGVHFCIQKKYMEATSGGFPPLEFDTRGEIVPLEESSKTLELLFQFMYPQRPPRVADLDFEVLVPLAEAAEKYEVFSAMEFCYIQISATLPEHAAAILTYAAKHGYAELVDAAAPLLISFPLGDIATSLPENLLSSWIRYYGEWINVLQKACAFDPPILDPFPVPTSIGEAMDSARRREVVAKWKSDRCSEVLAHSLGGKVSSLQDLPRVLKTVTSAVPKISKNILEKWEQEVNRSVAAIPKFSILL
ncbi:hypothetical protein Hypma_004586 [Hypsizygus marmoreus]|uniref:BTB domain-containing protein n=1 Tax=Hypsizygus marmoreus TaxID=39966 RepID=A0A369K106_HYPMA|nr:hypothetical protein Hypma_004586 [Hypsizygus marmoreus]